MRLFLRLFITIAALLALAAGIANAATPQVSVSEDYACALAQSGSVSCWGANDMGQLGDGTRSDSAVPVAVKDVANAVQIDAGWYDACALIADGTVKCWGSNIYGALGTSAPYSEAGTATTIAGLSGVTKVAVGEATACAILSSPAGAVKCWGYGYDGELGVSSPPSSTSALQTPNIGGPASDIGVGYRHVCAVVSAGLKCWGANDYKQIVNTATTQYDTPISVPALASGVAQASPGAAHTCVLLDSGAIKCWGDNGNGQDGTGVLGGSSSSPQPSLITAGAIQLSYGSEHVCALVGDSARCWGDNSRGQLGDGTTTDSATPLIPAGTASGVTSLDAGGHNTCAIIAKAVKCWGDNVAGALGNGATDNHNAPVAVAGLSGATDVDVSDDHGCAVAGGQLQCWGAASIGQLGTGANGTYSTSPVSASTFGPGQTAVSVTRATTCSIDSGAVKCSGYGYFGQLGNNTSGASSPSAVSATILIGGTGKIDGGSDTTCAIPTSVANIGKVLCWGVNDSSLLGQGVGQDKATLPLLDEPTPVVGIASGASSVAINYTHACAVVSGALKCWGQNYGGSVTGTNAAGPFSVIQTPGLSGVSTSLDHAVALAYGSTCAIVTSPSAGIKCFGENNNGTLGDGTSTGSLTPVSVSGITTGVSAIAGGTSAFCAVVSGAVKCWGRNESGQLGNGTNVPSKTPVTVSGISNAIAVAGQDASFCALLADGGVKCWGEGSNGQLGAGGSLFGATPTDVLSLSLFPADPPAYVAKKIKLSFKLNGKIKRSGTKIKVPLKLSYAAPAGSNPATVCTGSSSITATIPRGKSVKLKVKFKLAGSTCTFKGTLKLPGALKGKKVKFKISRPANADVLAYKAAKTLKLK